MIKEGKSGFLCDAEVRKDSLLACLLAAAEIYSNQVLFLHHSTSAVLSQDHGDHGPSTVLLDHITTTAPLVHIYAKYDLGASSRQSGASD